MPAENAITRYLPRLVAGDIAAILADCRKDLHVDDPLGGHVLGRATVTGFLTEQRAARCSLRT